MRLKREVVRSKAIFHIGNGSGEFYFCLESCFCAPGCLNKDIYLSLGKRTKLAKNYNADIFISIHADSSRNKKAKGLSVFSLSNKASDREAELLAKRENKEDLAA